MPLTITWPEAVQLCKQYREYLSTLKIAPEKKYKAFLMTNKDIEELLNQRKDGKPLDGIRFYIGRELIDGEAIIRLIPVAVEKVEVDGKSKYNDWRVPKSEIPKRGKNEGKDGDDDGPIPIIGRPRPCPYECGDDDILNFP
ncbi:MAG TPA: hypothetical protein VIK74_07935 [Parasegetibacter sp.]|jgi:hypothetical protein